MILGIETSDLLCSVAFIMDDQLLAEYNHEIPRQHAAILGDLVEKGAEFLSENHLIGPNFTDDIKLVAVSIGPGSFTGLRIGLSYAQGFCVGKDIPIIGVSNHEILANFCPPGYTTVYTLIDARREEVYLAQLTLNTNNYFDIVLHNIVSRNELADHINENSVLIYGKSSILENKIITKLSKKQIIIIDSAHYSAARTARIGELKYRFQGMSDLSELEPLYIRPFAGIQ